MGVRLAWASIFVATEARAFAPRPGPLAPTADRLAGFVQAPVHLKVEQDLGAFGLQPLSYTESGYLGFATAQSPGAAVKSS